MAPPSALPPGEITTTTDGKTYSWADIRFTLRSIVLVILISPPSQMPTHNTSDAFVPIKGPPPTFYGSVAFGDYDGDGRPDILLTGVDVLGALNGTQANPITQIWRNTGNGFSNINANLPGVAY